VREDGSGNEQGRVVLVDDLHDGTYHNPVQAHDEDGEDPKRRPAQKEQDACLEVVREELETHIERVCAVHLAGNFFFEEFQEVLANGRVLRCPDPADGNRGKKKEEGYNEGIGKR
jgi:hypothetical protein